MAVAINVLMRDFKVSVPCPLGQGSAIFYPSITESEGKVILTYLGNMTIELPSHVAEHWGQNTYADYLTYVVDIVDEELPAVANVLGSTLKEIAGVPNEV